MRAALWHGAEGLITQRALVLVLLAVNENVTRERTVCCEECIADGTSEGQRQQQYQLFNDCLHNNNILLYFIYQIYVKSQYKAKLKK